MLKYRLIFYSISLLLTLGSAIVLNIFNLNLGIDIKGGELIEIQTQVKDIKKILQKLNINATIIKTDISLIIKGDKIPHEQILTELKKIDPESKIIRLEQISPSLSGELRKKSLLLVTLVLLFIGLYISIVFREKQFLLPSYLLGIIVILTLFHDILGTLGVYVILSKFYNFDFDTNIIIAFLVIAGFSVHDTIVVFSRLRENIKRHNKLNQEIFEDSIKSTLRRSINTSLTTIMAILPIFFLIDPLKYFVITLIVGIIIGTYSSICLAAPLLYDLTKK